MCGGTCRWQNGECTGLGLSPRVRGNLTKFLACILCPRSIPACAGEPWCWDKECLMCSVYPRVCGGTGVRTVTTSNNWGLSPRVRGNRWCSISASSNPGSIPACAGEPCIRSAGCITTRVYPRVCGGTCSSYSIRLSRDGLSPRVRGNPGFAYPSSGVYRSIPACAGEPLFVAATSIPLPVYPRVCGGTAFQSG